MSTIQKHKMRRRVVSGLTLAVFILLGGCADLSRSPFAPTSGVDSQGGTETASLTQTPVSFQGDGRSYITLSPHWQPPPALTKPALGKRVSKTVRNGRGGQLNATLHRVQRTLGGDGVGVSRASLTVKKKSMDRGKAVITMEVYSGSSINDVAVAFTPSGLAFRPNATLEIVLVGKVDKKQVQKAYHTTGKGEVTELPIKVRGGRKYVKIRIKVPGFSRYSLGGDDAGQNIMMMGTWP